MPALKTRLNRLEKDSGSVVLFATIPAGATLEEATRIYESNLRLASLRPQPRQIETGAKPMTLEEATAIVELSMTSPTNRPKANSDA